MDNAALIDHQPVSLLHQKEEAVKLVNQLLKQVVTLGDENQRLRNQLAKSIEDIKTVQGSYTHAEIVRIMHLLFHKAHGVRKALCERVDDLREQGAELPKITDTTWQMWRLSDKYPGWVVDELKKMAEGGIKPRHNHAWTQEEKDWIVNQFLCNLGGSNADLAKRASDHFKRKVNEAMIKSVLFHSSESRRKHATVASFEQLHDKANIDNDY